MKLVDMSVHFLSLLTMVNILLAIVIIFLERRNVAATWAWILILLFLPVAGFVLYIIFGQNLSKRKIFQLNAEHSEEFVRKLYDQANELEKQSYQFRDPEIKKYQPIIYMNLVSGYGLLTQDNEVEIFTDGKEKFDALLKDIRQAKDHIHLLYFVIKNDGIGNKIVKALTDKAREGIKVRVLYDDMGSAWLPARFFKPLIEAGGEVAAFFPSKWIPYINFRMNYRNHRKVVVIDGKIGYVGGINIGDEYLGLSPKFGYWRDTHLRLKGSSVDALQSRFFLDWNNASIKPLNFEKRYFPTKTSQGTSALQIVSSGPDSEWEQIKNGIIKMIYSAKERIDIQTPYFVPDDSLMHALKIAALSGVKIRLMIPNKPDHIFVYWATYSYIGELLKVGVRCFIYEKGFIHAKTIVVDGKIASVGTANFDVRSFKLNFEVNAFLFDVQVAGRLQEIFEQDLKNSREMTKEMYDKRSNWIKFKESISRLLSPIL